MLEEMGGRFCKTLAKQACDFYSAIPIFKNTLDWCQNLPRMCMWLSFISVYAT